MHGVDPVLWGYAAKCVVHVWNRTDGRHNPSPYYRRYGKEPPREYLGKFGCACYFKKQVGTKLQEKYRKGVCLGYCEESPAYMVGHYTDRNKFETVIPRDAKFDEATLVSGLRELEMHVNEMPIHSVPPAQSHLKRTRRTLAPKNSTKRKAGMSTEGAQPGPKRLKDVRDGKDDKITVEVTDEDVLMEEAIACMVSVSGKKARNGPGEEKWMGADSLAKGHVEAKGT
jgi:hypothetical protein